MAFGFTSNPVYVLTVLCLLVILSERLAKTKYGKQFGTALIVIVLAAILANVQLIPSASNSIDLYGGIFKYLAPISIFYLLLSVNLTAIKRAGLPMVGLFLLGSLTTAIGVLISWNLLAPENVLGENGEIIAGMLTGTYTGGSVNFNAIAIEYDFQDKGILYAGTIAVDNVVTTVWIIATLSIPIFMQRFWKPKNKVSQSDSNTNVHPEEESMDYRSLMWLAFLGLAAFFFADTLSHIIPQVPSILILTTIGIILAQFKFIARLKGSQNLGLYLVYLFLAVIGAYCELGAVAELKEVGLTLLLFAGFSVLLHGLLLVFLGGLIYRDWDMIAIVSQANVGGGTTAIALAETFDRKELILPAILVGSLGNALGTYLGFLVIYIL